MKIEKEKKPLDKLYRRRNRYDLQPDFQRGPVWDTKMEQKLLDTILNKWDIPKIYLNVQDSDSYEVVDGQQRLTAVHKFYDNEIPLSEDLTPEYGGLFYTDLPTIVQDIFDDYEIDLVLLNEASDEDIRELFARLQLGKALNTGEKLNARVGSMRDFAKTLSEKEFFTDKVALRNTRFSHLSICGQLCILGIKGPDNHKFNDISNLFTSSVNFDPASEYAMRIEKVVSLLSKIFPDDFSIFSNRASITTIFSLLIDLDKAKYDFTEANRKLIRDFYVSFNDQLKGAVEKGAESDDVELIVYQSKVTQGADNSTSIRLRKSILTKRLIAFDTSFQKFFSLTASDLELLDFRKKETIKELKDSCLAAITDINTIYRPINNHDLFKMTTEVLSGSLLLSKPLESDSDFRDFIDALYKIFYEGSGSLNRIPDELKKGESVYFDIKHLRTDLFHDVEHGKKEKIDKKIDVIANAYKKYSGKNSIKELKGSDLIKFQRDILKKIDSELQGLKSAIV